MAFAREMFDKRSPVGTLQALRYHQNMTDLPAQQERFLIFIPAYNCAKQVPRVLRQMQALPSDMAFEVLVLDNQSPDDTLAQAAQASRELSVPVKVARNCQNYGLGGSHKAAFTYAIQAGFSHVIVLHGDDQGSIVRVHGVPGVANAPHGIRGIRALNSPSLDATRASTGRRDGRPGH